MEFGKVKDLKYIAVHITASKLGVMFANALPFFHVLRGCDNALSIFGKSKKKTFYDAWKLENRKLEIGKVFVKLAPVQ